MTERPKRRGFTMVPDVVDDSGLDPYEVRLYLHYARLCRRSRLASETVRETAQACGMSRGKLLAARETLVSGGWIKVELTGTRGHERTTIELLDRWDQDGNGCPPPGHQQAEEGERPGGEPVRPGGDTAVHQPASADHEPDASGRVEGQCVRVVDRFKGEIPETLERPERGVETGEARGRARDGSRETEPPGEQIIDEAHGQEVWAEALNHLQRTLPEHQYTNYLAATSARGFDAAGALVVEAANPFHLNYLDGRLGPAVHKAAAAVVGDDVQVRWLEPPPADPLARPKIPRVEVAA